MQGRIIMENVCLQRALNETSAAEMQALALAALAAEFNRMNNLLEQQFKKGGVLEALNGLRNLNLLNLLDESNRRFS
jgi:hypothetical protein